MASTPKLRSLYDTLDSNDNDETQKKDVSEDNLAEITPHDLVAYDMKNQKAVYDETDALSTSLVFCEQIVIAAYKVADYVPDLSDDKYSSFWKHQVIPNLVQSLEQDVRARSIIVRCFSSIRDLSITIQKAAEIVEKTKGSTKAIEIAQKNIPDALKTLEQCIELALTIETSAIDTFASQTTTLFKIIGPEAVKFVDEKAEIEGQLKKLYDEQRKLYTELGDKQGEVNRINHLIGATQKQFYGATQALEKTKSRTDALNQLNAEVEQTIKSIPVSTQQTTTTHKRHGYWRWFWPRSEYSTTTNTVMVQNPNREGDKKYYESIVLSRMERIRDNQNDEAAKQRVMNDLNVCLSEYTRNYEKATADLQDCQRTLPEKIKSIQDQIDKYHKKIEGIDKKDIDISNKIGHQGNTLIQCLIEVRTFSKVMKKGTEAYAPLVSILKGIKAMVQNEVQLLSSSKPEEIFLAGNLLLKKVQFLSSYSAAARQVLQPSDQYNSIANAIEFKKGYKNN